MRALSIIFKSMLALLLLAEMLRAYMFNRSFVVSLLLVFTFVCFASTILR